MHQIRLREPWILAEDSTCLSQGGFRASLQNDGLHYFRKFNAPTGISREQSLAIHLQLASSSTRESAFLSARQSGGHGLGGHIQLSLNGTLLDAPSDLEAGSCRFTISTDLKPFNELSVRISDELAALRPEQDSKLTDLLDVALLIFD